jgi:hypothetical protein
MLFSYSSVWRKLVLTPKTAINTQNGMGTPYGSRAGKNVGVSHLHIPTLFSWLFSEAILLLSKEGS